PDRREHGAFRESWDQRSGQPKANESTTRGRPGCAEAAPHGARPSLVRCSFLDLERAGEGEWLVGYRSVHARLRTVSFRLAVVAGVADGSKPQWIPQCSQRGSLPGP